MICAKIDHKAKCKSHVLSPSRATEPTAKKACAKLTDPCVKPPMCLDLISSPIGARRRESPRLPFHTSQPDFQLCLALAPATAITERTLVTGLENWLTDRAWPSRLLLPGNATFRWQEARARCSRRRRLRGRRRAGRRPFESGGVAREWGRGTGSSVDDEFSQCVGV